MADVTELPTARSTADIEPVLTQIRAQFDKQPEAHKPRVLAALRQTMNRVDWNQE